MLKDIKVFNIYYGTGDIVNSIFIHNSETLLIIDTGVKEKGNELINEIEKYNFNKLFIVITHAHPDHIGNNNKIKERYNPIFISNMIAKRLLENYKLQIDKLNSQTMGFEVVSKEIEDFWFSHMDKEVLIDVSFDRKMELQIGKRNLSLISLPGHTLEDIGIIDKDNSLLILSELIFDHSRGMLIFIDDSESYLSSLDKIEEIVIKEDIKYLITSHVPDIFSGKNKILDLIEYNRNYVKNLRDETKKIYKINNSVVDTAKKISEIYKKPYSLFSIYTIKAIIK